jgi:antitoxin (DNA-binding transcriptional repressor) of toxin-antitoxin stability system
MLQVAVNQAKNQLSALIHAVEEGQDVVLTRHGKPVVRMVREAPAQPVVSREQQMQEAIERLRAFQALVKPAQPGYTDWRTLRDEGRE